MRPDEIPVVWPSSEQIARAVFVAAALEGDDPIDVLQGVAGARSRVYAFLALAFEFPTAPRATLGRKVGKAECAKGARKALVAGAWSWFDLGRLNAVRAALGLPDMTLEDAKAAPLLYCGRSWEEFADRSSEFPRIDDTENRDEPCDPALHSSIDNANFAENGSKQFPPRSGGDTGGSVPQSVAALIGEAKTTQIGKEDQSRLQKGDGGPNFATQSAKRRESLSDRPSVEEKSPEGHVKNVVPIAPTLITTIIPSRSTSDGCAKNTMTSSTEKPGPAFGLGEGNSELISDEKSIPHADRLSGLSQSDDPDRLAAVERRKAWARGDAPSADIEPENSRATLQGFEKGADCDESASGACREPAQSETHFARETGLPAHPQRVTPPAQVTSVARRALNNAPPAANKPLFAPALPDTRNEIPDPRRPRNELTNRLLSESHRGVTSFRPDPPAEKRGAVNVTGDLMGDPSPERSALGRPI